MNEVKPKQHHVAIAGFVSDALTKIAIAGADVLITSVPEAFATRLELFRKSLGRYGPELVRKWNNMTERPDRIRSRGDGSFYFLDLPDGEYGLTISAPAFGVRYGNAELKIKVPFINDDKTTPDWPVVGLPPTAIQGTVTSKKTNVSFAHIRVKGSGESVITNKAGQYLITRVEPGQKTLLVNAPGYKTVTQNISIGAAGEAPVVNFNLLADKT